MNYKCQICSEEFNNLHYLQLHIKSQHKEVIDYDYYLEHINPNSNKCEYCGEEKEFLGFKRGYKNTCGHKECKNKYRKQCFKKRHGYEHNSQLESIKKQKEEKAIKKYGCKNVLQAKEIKDKIKQTNLKKYGKENPSQVDKIKQKKIETTQKNFNTDYPFQSDIVKEKIDKTNLERYNTIHPTQNEEIIEKRKKVFQKNYGSNSPLTDEKIKKKCKETLRKNYNVDNPMQSKDIQEKLKKVLIERYGEDIIFKTKKFIEDNKNKQLKNFYDSLYQTNRLNNLVKPLFTFDEYKGSKKIKYKFQCLQCNKEFEDYLQNGKIPTCLKCYPTVSTSKVEKEIQDWIKEVYKNKLFFNEKFRYNNNKQFYELDIYIPDKNIGIELNGLYWHSENKGKDKRYHLNKLNFFKDNFNINVLNIWDIEWINKKEIIQSIISNKLGLIKNKVFARKCIILTVSNKDTKLFLEENHLQGSINSKISIGLYYNNELVQIMTFSNPRFNKKYEYELIRMCSKLDYQVIGGFSKLLKYFVTNYSSSLISYADKRYSIIDNTYSRFFDLIKESPPNYFYTKDYKILESRIKYQKHKLKNKLSTFDSSLTEWENMKLNKYDRVWDCGNFVLEYKK